MASATDPGGGSTGPVRAVLADLDDTLFDHWAATRAALGELRREEPALAARPFDALAVRHREVLEVLHLDVLAGRLSIDEARRARFRRLVAEAGGDASEARIAALAAAYRAAYERGWRPVPGAAALVRAIRDGGLALVIVTNNSLDEQRRKLDAVGLAPAVSALVTSEEAGVSKPDPRIFDLALDRAGVEAGAAVMLGDAWATDVEGARRAGVRPVWFNRFGADSPDPAVAELRSLEPAAGALAVLAAG